MSEKEKNSPTMSVGVLGGGAFGTALAKRILENGVGVDLWCHDRETEELINNQHENKLFLPGVSLPHGLKASTDISRVSQGKTVLLLVTPSQFLLDVARQLITVPDVAEGRAIIACATKGFILDKEGKPGFIIETLENYLPGFYKGNLVYISGPSHAEELGRGKLTALVAASLNAKNSIVVRNALSSQYLRVFPSLDVVGVQVSAAVKNVIAIAFGAIEAYTEGSDFLGDNAESFLLASGLNEMLLLGRAMGATHPETFTSIAGVGDLDVTCRSKHGRNRRFGHAIIKENILDSFTNIQDLAKNVVQKVGYLPEGVFAAIAVNHLLEQYTLKLPIFQTLYSILDKKVSPAQAIRNLVDL
ncbi:MAG: NAD(P)H-dependent glycerol-3-phosphate dehydrogenase [Spirochaetia bacterium]